MAFALAASLLNNHFKDIQESNGLPRKTLYGSRKHLYLSQSSLDHKEEVNRTCNNYEGPKKSRNSRDVVARSELTGTGSPGASYPLSEIWLNSKVRGICFYAVTACAAIITFVPMLLQHPFVLIFDRYRREAHHLVAKTWAFLTVAPFFKIEYQGLENLPTKDTPAMYVSNHQSFLDIYTLLTLGRSFNDCLKQCITLIKKGASIFFFPEGTRSKDGKLGPFKKGAFSVAAKTGVPVVPITLIGTGGIMPAGMEGKLNPGSVNVIVHPSIIGNNPDELCSEARNVIARGLIRKG
ncbi:hypothetical protein OROGR_013554 [Orobanche gracilis]